MTKHDPAPLDDEDPFADSFDSFDEAEAVADDAATVSASEAPADLAPAALEAPAPAEAGEDAPFDWFAEFPKADFAAPEPRADVAIGPAPAGLDAPESDAPAADDGADDGEVHAAPTVWISDADRVALAAEPMPAPNAPVLHDAGPDADPAFAPEYDAETPGVAQEPEALADAPSVPAAFDDALTEPQPFDLLAAPITEESFADFAFDDPEPAPAPRPVAEMIASADAALGEAMVPRIAIHVFAQRAETAAMAQTAAADRRLQRASTAVRPGGLPEALALYGSSPTPALVIVENTAPAAQLLGDLDRLAEVCDPGTKVVVIGEANDIGLYRELIRRGVSEYLVPPLNALQLIRTISSLYTDPDTPFVGRTIAFVGAKGGVGSSTLAHNFAWCLAERIEAQACVVDYDLAFGTAGLDFNQDPVQGLYDALAKPDRLDATLIERMLARCTDRLSLFAAPATLDDDYDISAEAYEEVSGKIRSTAPFMVLDLPHVWSGWMRRTLLAADDVVLVAQPDLASLRNAKNMIEVITKARPNDAPPRLVLNQVGLPGRPEIPLKEFGKALGIEPSMIVPFDAKLFGQAANNGQMIGEVNPKAKASDALLQFAQAITRREAAAAKPKSLVERLLKGG